MSEDAEKGLAFVPLQQKTQAHKFDTSHINAIQKRRNSGRKRGRSVNKSARISRKRIDDYSDDDSVDSVEEMRIRGNKKRGRHRRAQSERLGRVDMTSKAWKKLTKGQKLKTLEREKRDIEEKIQLLENRRQRRLTLSLRTSMLKNKTPKMRRRGGPVKGQVYRSMAAPVQDDDSDESSDDEEEEDYEKFSMPKKLKKKLRLRESKGIKTSIMDYKKEAGDSVSNIYKSSDGRGTNNVFGDFEEIERAKLRKRIKKQFSQNMEEETPKKRKRHRRKPTKLMGSQIEENELQKMEREFAMHKIMKKKKKRNPQKKREREKIGDSDEDFDNIGIVNQIELSDEEIDLEEEDNKPQKKKRKKKKPKPPEIVVVPDSQEIDEIIKNDPRLSEMSRKKRQQKSKRKKKKQNSKGSFYNPENLKKYEQMKKMMENSNIVNRRNDLIDIQEGEIDLEHQRPKKKKKKKKRKKTERDFDDFKIKENDSIEKMNFFVNSEEDEDDDWN